MAKIRLLEKAPIIEAIVDIRVKPSTDQNLSNLLSIHSSISEKYPQKRDRVRMQGHFDVTKREIESSSTVDGYIFTSEDNKQVVQSRMDGFSFSRLKPYECWENLRDEALHLWKIYLNAVNPVGVSRVALRYINKLEFPAPVKKISEYLTSPPTVPRPFREMQAGFFSRNVIRNTKMDNIAIITQALDPAINRTFFVVVLDIDVFKRKDFSVSGSKYRDVLEELRKFKNDVFFNSVTERAVKLWE